MGKRNSKRPTWRGDFRPGTRSELAPRALFRRHMGDLPITRGAMLTLVAMLDLSDPSLARIWHSRITLAEKRGVAPCTITRHVRELEAAGAIEVDRANPFNSEALGRYTRWRTNRYRFCRHRRARRERPARAPAPEPMPAVSSPPAADEGELFERAHPPPPRSDDSPRKSVAEVSRDQRQRSVTDSQKAREDIARFREEVRPSPRVVRLREEARRKNFELSEH